MNYDFDKNTGTLEVRGAVQEICRECFLGCPR